MLLSEDSEQIDQDGTSGLRLSWRHSTSSTRRQTGTDQQRHTTKNTTSPRTKPNRLRTRKSPRTKTNHLPPEDSLRTKTTIQRTRKKEASPESPGLGKKK